MWVIWSPRVKGQGVQLERKKWPLFNVHKALLSVLRTGKGGLEWRLIFKLIGSGNKLQGQEPCRMLRSVTVKLE